MKYTIIFGFMSGWCIWEMITGTNQYRYLLLWPAINMFIFAIVYATNNPILVCGKRKSGDINLILLIINLPWLLFSWVTFIVQKLVSRENPMDQIEGTSWFISAYPGLNYKNLDYDFIIDLTAEFPRPLNAENNYLCISNLDGVPLSNIANNINLTNESRVLVHCAQGHGRSATWCSIALAEFGIFPDVKSAYDSIKASRPGARASKAQESQIMSANNALKADN